MECFVPHSVLRFFAALYETTTPKGITHKAMTRMAILQVASDLLQDYPFNEESRARITALGSEYYSEEALLLAYFGEARTRVVRVKKKFEEAIEDISEANSDVDSREAHLPSAHFDAEHFQKGQNRIAESRQKVVNSIRAEMYEAARSETGRMLHTLQDFYSHSNWVEMGNSEPYRDLGKDGTMPVVAPSTAPTCTDCEEDGLVLLDFIPFVTAPDHHYKCSGNIRNDILSAGLLTSGYYSKQYDEVKDEETKKKVKVKVVKPPGVGKCSHGGYLDATSDDYARGGMNKDSPYPKLSPHSSQHYMAADIAEQATVEMFNMIREEVDDDEKFGTYLNLFVKTAASIAYVIDTTGSMGEELPQIQASIPQIRADLQAYRDSIGENAAIRYILVPFNDPGLFIAVHS